jgi:outer membrane protein
MNPLLDRAQSFTRNPLRHSRTARAQAFVWLCLCLLLAPSAAAQKVSFRHALELALTHSAGMGMALADQLKAQKGIAESRNMYIPQVTFASGVAKTWGYPMSIEGSAPSLFNITSQSFLINLAQQNFIRAAHTDLRAANLSLTDQRNATILETALTYMQLDQGFARLAALKQQLQQAEHLETVSRERLQEGVDSKVDLTRTMLVAARVRLRLTEAQSDVDLLRQRLAQLTGLDPRELDTDPNSIPPRPVITPQENFSERALQNSPAIKAADEKARARQQRAEGERKQLYPAVDMVGNYGLFTKYNNLDLLFPSGRFSRHNATFGVDIRFPFLNAAQHARAGAAEADALRARKEAQAAREQVANDTLKLQRSVQQSAAALQVASLDYQLALASVDAVEAKLASGAATIKDQENARIEASDKYAALLDAQYQLDRLTLQLLRNTGELEKWALP